MSVFMTISLLHSSYFSQTYKIWSTTFVEALAFIFKYANLTHVSAIIFLDTRPDIKEQGRKNG